MMYQVSFVFQGVFFDDRNDDTLSNIKKVRVIYPRSEIILSTWSLGLDEEKRITQKLKEIDVKVIFNKDPGPLIFRDGSYKWVTNINRMIVSTKNGVEAASRAYVAKLRTDSFFINDNLKSFFLKRELIGHKYNRDREFSLFSERIINCNLFARHSRSYRPFDFHPGDIMLLGRKNDVLNYFDVSLADESIFDVIFNKSIFSLMSLVPEQYLWVSYIKKMNATFNYNGNKEKSKEITFISEKYYINNFIPLSCQQLGFFWPKYGYKYKNKGNGSIYHYSDWVRINEFHNNHRTSTYRFWFDFKIISIKWILFFLYLPLRYRFIRRILMNLKSRI